MTEEVAGISWRWFAGPGGRSLILNSQFSIIDAGERLGLLGCGARGLARAAGIQNAELELGVPRIGHRGAELVGRDSRYEIESSTAVSRVMKNGMSVSAR